jgi:hypothetical protein
LCFGLIPSTPTRQLFNTIKIVLDDLQSSGPDADYNFVPGDIITLMEDKLIDCEATTLICIDTKEVNWNESRRALLLRLLYHFT